MAFQNSTTRISELIVDLLRTADPPGIRWELSSEPPYFAMIRGFGGLANEANPASLMMSQIANSESLVLNGPAVDGSGYAQMTFQGTGLPSNEARLDMQATAIGLDVNANVSLRNLVTNAELDVSGSDPGITLYDPVNSISLHATKSLWLIGDQRIRVGLSGQLGRLAQGNIATTNSIGLNTETLRLAAGPFPVYNGMRYKISGKCVPQADTAGAWTGMRLKYDTVSTGVGGTLVDYALKDHRIAGRAESLYSEGEFVWSGSNATNLYIKMTMMCNGGTGTDAAASFPSTWLRVDAVPNV